MYMYYGLFTGDLCDLTDNNKRWLLVGIGLHTVIIPALRKYVAPRLDQLWQNLKTTNKIDVQVYPHQMKSYLSTFFNYEAINNNRSLGVKQQAKFDYRVKDSTDLSKLFLQTNMALHSVIDENCDLSALLCIIIKAGICPGSAIDFAERVCKNVIVLHTISKPGNNYSLYQKIKIKNKKFYYFLIFMGLCLKLSMN